VAALRLAARWNGMNGIALTKLDVLRGMKRIKICVGYTVGNEQRDELPTDPVEIAACVPVYEELDGWEADTREVRDRDALPPAAKKYVSRIEALVGVDLSLISVGPGRAETIVLKNPFR
jgi:adenylosuccinate synthase